MPSGNGKHNKIELGIERVQAAQEEVNRLIDQKEAIKKELLELMPRNAFYNATDFIDLLIEKGKRVVRFPITGNWIDIGKPEDYKRAQDLARHIEM